MRFSVPLLCPIKRLNRGDTLDETGSPCHRMCGTIKSPACSKDKAPSTGSNYAVGRLQMNAIVTSSAPNARWIKYCGHTYYRGVKLTRICNSGSVLLYEIRGIFYTIQAKMNTVLQHSRLLNRPKCCLSFVLLNSLRTTLYIVKEIETAVVVRNIRACEVEWVTF